MTHGRLGSPVYLSSFVNAPVFFAAAEGKTFLQLPQANDIGIGGRRKIGGGVKSDLQVGGGTSRFVAYLKWRFQTTNMSQTRANCMQQRRKNPVAPPLHRSFSGMRLSGRKARVHAYAARIKQ